MFQLHFSHYLGFTQRLIIQKILQLNVILFFQLKVK
jgi:hypothetical protein